VIVLALDTATPAVTAGVLTLDPSGPPRLLAARVTVDARAHGELLMPHVRDTLAEAGVKQAELAAIVVGSGPGPFTGLRVGLVTAAALGDGLGLPVHPVVSLDAIAAEADADGQLLVCTDARRREVYWAAYTDGRRTEGPQVQAPAELTERLTELGVTRAAGDPRFAELLGLTAVGPVSPGPVGLVAVAADALRAGAEPAPLTPHYLRRPDAVEPGASKQVGR
jgi:tRNA threonylcarbamoyl adenosine modification protein YeaZ